MLQFTDFLFIGSKATYTCTNSVTGAIGGQTRQCRDGRWDREPYPCCELSVYLGMKHTLCNIHKS